MFVIGERINGMFKDVAEAIKTNDSTIIQKLAKKQVENSADALDINVGPGAENPLEAMAWLVTAVQEVTDKQLVIDTTKRDVMEKGLSLCTKARPIINSTSADDEKMEFLFGLAKKFNAQVIALTMNKSGVPQTAEARTEMAMQIVAKAAECGVDSGDLYIDAVILPVNVAQPHIPAVMETIRNCKMLSDPPPKTVLGLSNVSQGSLDRPLINRTALAMAIDSGLDSAIMDPMDKELMDTAITAELLLEKQIYCDSYINAYRKR